jgi:hypothetical protein
MIAGSPDCRSLRACLHGPASLLQYLIKLAGPRSQGWSPRRSQAHDQTPACKHKLTLFIDLLLHSTDFQAMFVACSLGLARAMPIRSFVEPGAFDPEAIAAMSEALEAAVKELQGTGEPEVVRERIATRIIAAAKLGERDPARLLEAALCEPD